MGIARIGTKESGEITGFPHLVQTSSGEQLLLDLERPGLLGSFPPERIGIAVLDLLGFTLSRWGLAEEIPHFKLRQTILDTPIAGLLESDTGNSDTALFFEGRRYIACQVRHPGASHVVVLVTDAREEAKSRHLADWRLFESNAQQGLSEVLVKHHDCNSLCVSAVHHLVSSLGLSAALLWVVERDCEQLSLRASVGVNRTGLEAVKSLKSLGSSCLAELALAQKRSFLIKSVADHWLSVDLEAKFCYLRPRGAFLSTLLIGKKVVGVLELIGRASDREFMEREQVFLALCRQVSLGLAGATSLEFCASLESVDLLTGLANHQALQKALQSVDTSEQPLSAIVLEVDGLREINVEEGYRTGDAVLQELAKILTSCAREHYVVARDGGVRFTLLMPEAGAEQALLVSEEIRTRVEQHGFETSTGKDASATVSVGCATLPQCPSDRSILLEAATAALNEAKGLGGNQVRVGAISLKDASDKPVLELAMLKRWFTPAEWDRQMDRLETLQPEMERLIFQVALNEAQSAFLTMLLVAHSLEITNEMRECPSFSSLLRCLERAKDRFDIFGSNEDLLRRPPLLTRVLQVLIAVEQGQDLTQDPGRLDPAIVALALEQRPAA